MTSPVGITVGTQQGVERQNGFELNRSKPLEF